MDSFATKAAGDAPAADAHGTDLDAGMLAGLADLCELMAAAFSYPGDGRLARALCDGSYADDLRGALLDAGACRQVVDRADAIAGELHGRRADDLAAALRQGHSVLFLAPGSEVPVWPYEAPFKFVAQGRSGLPSLFRSPVALDVERTMRAAGVVPRHARTEPVDSIWNEFSFAAYLLAQACSCVRSGAHDAAGRHGSRAVDFAERHLATWVPAFFEQTEHEAAGRAHGAEYGCLARIGTLVWGELERGLNALR